MFKALFLSIFLTIASWVLIGSLNSPVLSKTVWIAQMPTTYIPTIAAEVESAQPHPDPQASEPETEPANPNPPATADRTGNPPEETSTADDKASGAGVPYDMDAIRAFDRALYGS